MHSKSKVTMISNEDFNTSLRGFWSMDKVANFIRRCGRAGKFSITHTTFNQENKQNLDAKRFVIEVDTAYTSWQIGQKSLRILSEETVMQ